MPCGPIYKPDGHRHANEREWGESRAGSPPACVVCTQCEQKERGRTCHVGAHMAWAVGSVPSARPSCCLAHHSLLVRLATAARIKSWQMKVGAGRWIDGPTDGREYETAVDGSARSVAAIAAAELTSSRVRSRDASRTDQGGTGQKARAPTSAPELLPRKMTCLGVSACASAPQRHGKGSGPPPGRNVHCPARVTAPSWSRFLGLGSFFGRFFLEMDGCVWV